MNKTAIRIQSERTPAFRNTLAFLSNFARYSPHEYFEFEGILYPSNEHYYQAQKFKTKKLKQQIADHSAKGLKQLVDSLPHRKDVIWSEVKLDVMRIGLIYKFVEVGRFRKLLIETGKIKIVERNTWGDTYWGECNGKGDNNLGKLIMQIRETLL